MKNAVGRLIGRAHVTLPLLSAIFAISAAQSVFAGDWANWRGPERTGVSRETGLPDKFSLDPKNENSNLIWKAPFGGRSTPIVMNGRVYLIGNVGEGLTDQERVVCCDANTGKMIWEQRFNVFMTDIVAVRVGWTNLAGDQETDRIYAHGVQGMVFCFEGKTGKIVWSHSLTEEYGRISGYGGRVCSPVVDGDLVIVGMVNGSWGRDARGDNRFVAFDKRTGDVVWWASTGSMKPGTYYSVPVVAVINGVRLMITGSSDGGVHAFQVHTGKKVWSHFFAANPVNCSPVVEGSYVYIGHGQENLDTNVQGRIICLDAAEVKDGKPKLVWDRTGIRATYCSPIIHDGRLYICDETAKMFCLDAKNGKTLWAKTYGRNAKGSPIWADGKIYVANVNSEFLILKPKEKGFDVLHKQFFQGQTEAPVEINGSPAAVNGRVYFMTSEELVCIGLKKPGEAGQIPAEPKEEKPESSAKTAWVQVTPADVVLNPGESVTLHARLFDVQGRFLREEKGVKWSLAGMLPPDQPPGTKPPPPPKTPPAPPPALKGAISEEGKLTVDKAPPGQFGRAVAEFDGVIGYSRIRVAPALPYAQDFEKVPEGRTPGGWVNTQGKFAVRKKGDSNVLVKLATVANPAVARAYAFIGKPTLTNYTIESDMMGGKVGGDLADMGVDACRYTFFLDGNKQLLRLVSWDTLPRVDKTISFPWKPDVWYRMKFRVQIQGGKALAQGKVWIKGEKEPEKWTLEFTDPVPNLEGSPALYAYATGILDDKPGAEVYFDNVVITPNKKTPEASPQGDEESRVNNRPSGRFPGRREFRRFLER